MITSEIPTTPELAAAGFIWHGRDGVMVLSNTGLTNAGFTNGFSTRAGGVSAFPHHALNLAGYNEDAATNIEENRRRFLAVFDGNWSLATVWQIHSAAVSIITGPTDPVAELDRCDALVGNLPGILAAVKTADCVPVLLGDPRTGAYAAIHAGWRGTLEEIVKVTVEKLQDKCGVDPFDLQAAIGPAAGRCCYEVGDDVITAFRDRFPYAAALFEPTREGHARIDLHQANFNQLIAAGVPAEKIQVAPLCTIDRNDLFFSYRQEKKLHGKTGRLLSVIGRKP
ncbi:MAG: peptidoglycan editing factor PgeF [Pyrinomonadaceae bacterium]